jgi:acyl-CoA thioester hydrolase
LFTIAMSVRDYECDMQGVVNNAIYQHYLEHARHEFLKSRNLDFAQLTAQGVIVVVVRAEIDYRRPLRSGDAFAVSVEPDLISPVRLMFSQRITHAQSAELIVTARITTTAVNARGRPYFPQELAALLSAP